MDWKRAGELRERVGDKRFAAEMINRINDPKFDTKEFSLGGLYEALGRPNLGKEKEISNRILKEADFEIQESVDSTMFPKITGSLINRVIQEAYNKAQGMTDALVTVMQSTVRDETIVGMTDDHELMEVPEGIEYTRGAIGEKYHKIRNRKWGRIVPLTEEVIKFDQTGQMMMRAAQVGESASIRKDKEIFDKVLSITESGDYASWRPAGTATALYSATSNDPYTSGTIANEIADVLSDETDLDAAYTAAASFTDEQGEVIMFNPKILLVGAPLRGTANKIINSQSTLIATYNSGVTNPWHNEVQVISSSYVNSLQSATHWYLGDFKKQFIFTEVFPLQTFQAKPGNEKEFDSDVIYQVKARWMGGCGAISNRYVIESTGGS